MVLNVHRNHKAYYGRREGAIIASELRSCVKVEVAVLGSPSLIIRTVSVDVKQHSTNATASGSVA